MATVITHSTGTITPEEVNGFASAREARTIIHTILGRSDPDVTLRPAGLRTGTLKLVFATGAASAAAEAVVRYPQVLTLSDADVPEVGMSFVVAEGEITNTLDLETQAVWVLEVPYQEVSV